ncbi:MAG: SPOR domain-containing protein [Acidobacteriota bacterium]
MDTKYADAKEGELRDLLLQITLKEKRARNRSIFYVIIPILVGGLWLFFSLYQLRALKEESRRLSEEIQQKKQELKELDGKVNRRDEFIEAFASSEALVRRRAVTIQYVANSSQKERVETALQRLGFTRIKSQANPTNTPPDTILFGSSVDLEDVKLVAYAFISAGAQIKEIRPFYDSSERASAIEVGSSKAGIRKPALVVQDIPDIGPFRPGNAFPVVGSFTDRNEALGFARKSKLRFTPYALEMYLAENDYYAVTLGGYMNQAEASKRVRFAKDKGAKDAYVWVSDNWGDNLLKE